MGSQFLSHDCLFGCLFGWNRMCFRARASYNASVSHPVSTTVLHAAPHSKLVHLDEFPLANPRKKKKGTLSVALRFGSIGYGVVLRSRRSARK